MATDPLNPILESFPPGTVCPCVKFHRPKAMVLETHHLEPLSWGGENVPENRIIVCIQTHYTIHTILNLYVHNDGHPPLDALRPFPSFARIEAAHGWDRHMTLHPDHPTPFGP